MKLAKTLLALGVTGLLSVPAFAGKAGKVPATEKECTTPKSKKAGWVWDNGSCVKKKDEKSHGAEKAVEGAAPAEGAAPTEGGATE